ncbi:hypothetical protein PM082_010746 [Marasmius tenuissimus]|nr:hypothetical protein PM082_010746 [Marasmius tenuissimus]
MSITVIHFFSLHKQRVFGIECEIKYFLRVPTVTQAPCPLPKVKKVKSVDAL